MMGLIITTKPAFTYVFRLLLQYSIWKYGTILLNTATYTSKVLNFVCEHDGKKLWMTTEDCWIMQGIS